MPVVCPYCNSEAVLVDGSAIYPHRPDLHHKKFWHCAPCGAYVGCHGANKRFGSDGTKPLGRLANAELRRAKTLAHAAFDPLWKTGHWKRSEAYAWLAKELEIPIAECHIGEMDLFRCQRTVNLCTQLKHDLGWD